MQITKSWQEFEVAIDKLVEMMGDYKPDVIIPSMNGGLVPAGILAEKLSQKDSLPFRDVRPISIERIGDKRIIRYDVQGDISGLNVLLLDDDLPTGKGFQHAKQEFQRRGAKVKIAAVYVNSISEKLADFYGEKLDPLPNLPWKPTRSGDRIVRI
jgi:hypoxanthine phosphoribosyltransferase